MQSKAHQPIGIFDSGIGGLTVANAVTQLLPHESIIYFGDTAHAPWGDKSTSAIQSYSIKICDMLLQHGCKLILIACNTATAAAYDVVKQHVDGKALVLNVIDPMINHLQRHHAKQRVGLIGTKQTIHTNTYKKMLDTLQLDIQLHSLATPLLVPLIEEGFADHKITMEMISNYLSHPTLQNIEALILGCTHYPLIKKHIENFYVNKVRIIDSSEIVAKALQELLAQHNLANSSQVPAKRTFYVSDYTDAFADSTRLFFSEEIDLQYCALWD